MEGVLLEKPVGFLESALAGFVLEVLHAFVIPRNLGKERYGAVLRVNGENSIGKERRPDLERRRRWVLDPGCERVTVRATRWTSRRRGSFASCPEWNRKRGR